MSKFFGSGPVPGIAIAMLMALGAGPAAAEPADCQINAGTSGQFKYVVVKCAFKSEPGNYKINGTIWANQNMEAYTKLLPASGHSFTCDLGYNGRADQPSYEVTYYNITNCRVEGPPPKRK